VRLNTVVVPYEPGESFTFTPVGDLHMGNSACDMELVFRTLDGIRADPRALWGGMGDYIDAIFPNDPRWAAGGIDERFMPLSNQDRIADAYREKLSDLLHPIAEKCLFFGRGNHEETVLKHYYTDLAGVVAHDLKLPYSEWAGATKVVFSDSPVASSHGYQLIIFHQHGWQAGRMDGAKVNEARRLMAYIHADIYLVGHSHSKFVIPQARMGFNHPFTRIVQQEVYLAHTGSALKTLRQDVVSYAERAGYPPVSLGFVTFRITPPTHHDRAKAGGHIRVEAIQ